MEKNSITLSGYVLSQRTRTGLNITVEVWDKDNRIDDLLGKVVTGSGGFFSIALEEKAGGWNFTDLKPIIYFKLYKSE